MAENTCPACAERRKKRSEEEQKALPEKLEVMKDIIPSFCLQGIDRTMNLYNRRGSGAE